MKLVITLSCCAKKGEKTEENIKGIKVFFNFIVKLLKITKKQKCVFEQKIMC